MPPKVPRKAARQDVHNKASTSSSTVKSPRDVPLVSGPAESSSQLATIHVPPARPGEPLPPLNSYDLHCKTPFSLSLIRLSPKSLPFPALIKLMATRSDEAITHFKYLHYIHSQPVKDIPTAVLTMVPDKYSIPSHVVNRPPNKDGYTFEFGTILSQTAYSKGKAADFSFARMVEFVNAGEYLPDAIRVIKKELKMRKSWEDADKEAGIATGKDMITNADFLASVPSDFYLQYRIECMMYDFWSLKTYINGKVEQAGRFVKPRVDIAISFFDIAKDFFNMMRGGGKFLWDTLQSIFVIRILLQHMLPWVLFILLVVGLVVGIGATVLWGTGFLLRMAESQFPQLLLHGWLKAFFVSPTPMVSSIGHPPLESDRFTFIVSKLTLDLYRNVLTVHPLSTLLGSSLTSLQHAASIGHISDLPSAGNLSKAFQDLTDSTKGLASRGSQYEDKMRRFMLEFEGNVEAVVWILDNLEDSVRSYNPYESYFKSYYIFFLFILLTIAVCFWRSYKNPKFYVFVILPVLTAAYSSQCLSLTPLYNSYGCDFIIDIASSDFGYEPAAYYHSRIIDKALETSSRLHILYGALNRGLAGIAADVNKGHSFCIDTSAAFSRVHIEMSEVEGIIADRISKDNEEVFSSDNGAISEEFTEGWIWNMLGRKSFRQERIKEAYEWRAHGPRVAGFAKALSEAKDEFQRGMGLIEGWRDLVDEGWKGLKVFDALLLGDSRSVWEKRQQDMINEFREPDRDKFQAAADLIAKEKGSARSKELTITVASQMKILMGRFRDIPKEYRKGKDMIAKEGAERAERAKEKGLDAWVKTVADTAETKVPVEGVKERKKKTMVPKEL